MKQPDLPRGFSPAAIDSVFSRHLLAVLLLLLLLEKACKTDSLSRSFREGLVDEVERLLAANPALLILLAAARTDFSAKVG